jgi:hypothetical protein
MNEQTMPIDRNLARYQESLRHARAELRERLSTAEVSAILDVLNGHWFIDTLSVAYIYAEVSDGVRLNGLDEKWHINGPYLVGMLQQLTFIESCALADAAERWWGRVGAGEHDISPESALAD